MASQATLTPLIPFQPGFEKSAIAVKRQFGIMNGRRGAGKLVRTACYKIQMCRKIVSE
jgi:hypothetical protein